MRFLLFLSALVALFSTLAVADSSPSSPSLDKRDRVGVQFGKPGAALDARERSNTASTKTKEANYLVTLERTITNTAKDNILDVLLRSGAVVKEEYNYRVYKGILFTIPTSSDKGLTSWQSSLTKQDGVKYVEEDQVVKTQ
ncbi:hypothetical protein JCM8097_002057 [Rhodosporidiobolus ruineniae]